MNVSLQYKTHNRGRCTSSTSYTMGNTEQHPCISFTGVLKRIQQMTLDSVRHIWLSADHPVDLIATHQDGTVTTVEGILLYTTEYSIPLVALEIRRSHWVEEDDIVNLDLQAFASSSQIAAIPL